MKKCKMTVDISKTGWPVYVPCSKPAKYKTPNWRKEKPMYVCGIHKNSVNAMHNRLRTGLSCIPLKEEAQQ